MNHSFVIDIDESGDQGLGFEKGACSLWFVVACVIAPHTHALTETVKEAKEQIKWPIKKALHFKDVKLEKDRRTLLEMFTRDASLFRTIVIMVHKPSLLSPEQFREMNRMYFYFTRFLLERASWFLRATHEHRNRDIGDGTAKVVFSNFNEISRSRVAAYFSHLKTIGADIDWSIIDPDNFDTLSPGKSSGLQIADSIAGSFYCAEHNCLRKRTDEWVHILRPMMFRSSNGKYRGYGLKIFPPDSERLITQGVLSPWVTKHFPK